MFTEDEAKTKECAGDRYRNCSGSACMAWRVHTEERWSDRDLWHKATNKRVSGGVSSEVEWRPAEGATLIPATGYCGLAGRPSSS